MVVNRRIDAGRRRLLAADIARADAGAMLAVVGQVIAEQHSIALAESVVEPEAADALSLLDRKRAGGTGEQIVGQAMEIGLRGRRKRTGERRGLDTVDPFGPPINITGIGLSGASTTFRLTARSADFSGWTTTVVPRAGTFSKWAAISTASPSTRRLREAPGGPVGTASKARRSDHPRLRQIGLDPFS